MFRNEHIRIPLLGLVENMSYFTPPDNPERKYFIFGQSGCKKFASDLNIPLLAQIPIIPEITESGDSGIPIAADDQSPVALVFMHFAEALARQIAIQNAIKESFGMN
jgi:ATP-binding protein involved in chromosome partitioning